MSTSARTSKLLALHAPVELRAAAADNASAAPALRIEAYRGGLIPVAGFGYVTIDLAVQGYSDSTPAADVKTRISGLITNMVALGF